MCGRFYISRKAVDLIVEGLPGQLQAAARQLILDFVKEQNRPAPDKNLSAGPGEWIGHFDVRPTHTVPVVSRSGMERMRWGFHHGPNFIFNSMREKISGTWKVQFKMARVLIPAAGWFEWTGPQGSKQTHALFSRETTALGGIYIDDVEYGNCFSIITCPGADSIKHIHHRMPVLVPQRMWEQWLSPKTDPALLASMADTYGAMLGTFPCPSPKAGLVPIEQSKATAEAPPKAKSAKRKRQADGGLF